MRDDGIVGEPRTCLGQERVRPGDYISLTLRIRFTNIEIYLRFFLCSSCMLCDSFDQNDF